MVDLQDILAVNQEAVSRADNYTLNKLTSYVSLLTYAKLYQPY